MAAKEQEKIPGSIPNLMMPRSQIEVPIEEERERYESIMADGARGSVESFKDLEGSKVVIFQIELFVDHLRQTVSLEMGRQDAIMLRNRIDEIFKENDLPGYI
ncbi:MAG: hypothetical protein WC926_02025 [Candidatus Paceibacterota bacterium]|jgi:hypothetical protein